MPLLCSTLMLMAVAFFNRYPVLMPDSLDYLKQGSLIAHGLLLPRSWYTQAMTARSELYCLFLLLIHWNRSAWPVVLLNAIAASYTLWLLVRCLFGRVRTALYLAFVAALCALTSISWYVSVILPDSLGTSAYLALFILVVLHHRISRREKVLLGSILVLGVVAHATHLLIALAVCVLYGVLALFQCPPLKGCVRSLAAASALIVAAAAAQMVTHGYLYGTFSFSGQAPPYVMARFLGDGPARLYLQQHCSTLPWVICRFSDRLPTYSDDFLWNPVGVWQTSSFADRQRLVREERPLVFATLRSAPTAQLRKSLHNFEEQMATFHLLDFAPNAFVGSTADSAIPGAAAHYQTSRQARNALHLERFGDWQRKIVLVSAVALMLLLPLACWRRRLTLVTLALSIVVILVTNAFLCGVIAVVMARYETRIIWLLPMVTILLLADLAVNHLDNTDEAANPTLPSHTP